MSKIPTINEIDGNSLSQENKDVVVSAKSTNASVNEVDETLSGKATIDEVDNTRKPTISEIYQIVTDGLFESTTNWWDYAYRLSQAQINQDIVTRLDNGVIGGGYSKGFDIITTTSDKAPSNSNVYSALKSDTLYPKKLNDETINGIYNFVNGLTIGKPTAYTGGTWSIDKNGKSYLTTDYLYVRLKAIFETLQILDVDTIGGKMIVSPAGSIRVAYVDDKKVTIDDVEQNVYRCYFLGEQDGEEIDNKWKVGDQAQAKSFNIKKGTYHKAGNHYLWRLVVGVSTETVTIDNKKYHYIDLSQLVFDAGSDAPAPGDVLNQLGYRGDDVQRQSAIVINAVDNFAPSISLYGGINDFTLLNKEYVEYGVYQGKAFFNVYGDMYIGDRGINPTTYIKYKNGKVSIKADLEIGSSIGGKDLNQYIKDNAGVDEATVISIINNSQVIKDLQKQTDGAIETWFYDGAPTLTNEPAKNWIDKDTKDVHVGDLYYDRVTGYAYRFTRYDDDANPYRWSRITDTDITKALDAAAKAQATADSKMKIFYGSTPPTDYQVGDMWVNATLAGKFNNDIARATTASKTFNADHWVLASRYSEAIADILTWQNTYETKFSNLADTVKQQKDESVTIWFYEYAPTVSNAPANEWNTDALRNEHVGDIFYDIKNNHSYRWTGTAWIQIKDADFDSAMKAANDAGKAAGAASDLADSKRRIFYSSTTPSKPYDKGDLWLKQVNGKNETWVYDGTNWVKSNDKDLADFTNVVNKELEGIQGQLDGKAETWYQNTDPSTSWTDKSIHEGDIWYNTTNGTTNYWNGTSWEQMDIPKDVFDTIDGKSSIFVDSYDDAKAGKGAISKGYKERDLWILPADAVVNGTQYYKGDLLTATADGTAFNEKHWTKKVRYVGATELADSISQVNKKIDNISASTLPGLDNKFNEFAKDGILDSSEKARLTDLLAQASNEVAAANDQIKSVTSSTYLIGNANVGKLTEAQTGMSTAWTEYKTLIDKLIAGNATIDKNNIATANTLYNSLQLRLKEVKQYLAICQSDILSGLGTDLSTYKYLKEALNQTTEVKGGLVLTSAIQLKDTDSTITAGINGIIAGNKTAVAAWYGGPMKDRDEFTSEELKNKVAGTDYARSLFRHDGSGYLASGAIYWGTDGVLHGDPNSFILQGTSFATMFSYTRLFYLHYGVSGSTNINDVDYITPKKTFSRLEILPQGGTEGSSNLPTGLYVGNTTKGGQIQIGNIVLTNKGDNVLEITNVSSSKVANVGVSGGISAYGTYTPSTGGGGGLNGTVLSYANAIKITSEDLTKIPSAYSIKALSDRIAAIEVNGATNISVTGTGNAITGVSKDGTSITFTKGSTFLTEHQSLANCVQTVTTTGSGNAITTVSKSGSTITVTKGTTFLTSHQSFRNLVSTITTGTSDVTDGTEFLTSYASDSGFNDSNDVNQPFKRQAIHLWNYIKGKTDKIYLTSHQSLDGYINNVTQPTGSNVFVTSISKSGKTLTYTKSYTKKGATSVINSGWTNASIDGNIIPDMSFIAYWNGAYSSSGSSNLTYCNRGAFGTFAAKSSLAFSELTSKPTTLSGYGITDAVGSSDSRLTDSRYPKFANNTWYIVGDDVYIGDHNQSGTFCLKDANNGSLTGIALYAKDESSYGKIWYDKTNLNMNKQLVMANSRIWIQGSGTAGGNNNRLTLTAGMPAGLVYNTSCRGTILYSNGIAFADPYNGNSNNDSGWIRHLETSANQGLLEIAVGDDNLNEEIHFRWYTTNTSAETIGNDITVPRATGTLALTSQIPSSLKSPYSLSWSGYNSGSYDGSSAKSFVIPSNTNQLTNGAGFITSSGTCARVYGSVGDTGSHELVRCDMNNDQFRIIAGSGGNNNGWAEIATADDGSEPIYVRQYTGVFSSVKRTLTLLDANGFSYFPSYINIGGNEGNNSSPNRVWGSNGSDTFLRSYLTSALSVNYANSAGTCNGNAASATKLQTARSIWGQSFNGTGDITGLFVGSRGMKINGVWIGLNTNSESRTQTIDCDGGDHLYLNYYRNKNVITNYAGGNLGVGTFNNPSYKLHVLGDIYANGGWLRVSGTSGLYFESYGGGWYMSDSSWIRAFNNKSVYSPGEIQAVHIRSNSNAYFDTSQNAIRIGAGGDVNYLSGLSGQLIVHSAIRFGSTAWDWNQWAGLKYDNTNNIIYLGGPDNNIFNANSARTGGTINLRAGISSLLTSSITANGNILATGGITAYQTSDIRLKRNISKLNCLNVIKSIGGTYEFDYLRTGKHSIGFIAQRVNNPLLRDIVTRDSNDYLKINYWHPKLISLAFGAITEIDDEVTRLKARVRELENEVELLKRK